MLHLHLSDDHGWGLALSSRPELVDRAASTSVGGDPGGHYTAADYRAIIAHAERRHMTVIPEFDGPGHTHAAPLGLTLANGPTSVERSYRWEPSRAVPGIREADILGAGWVAAGIAFDRSPEIPWRDA